MTDIEVHLPVATQPTVETLLAYARTAEANGYDCVWLPETWGRDAVTILSLIARETEQVAVGSSILNTYSRSPALLGQTAATLQEVADGRFRLGIGPSGPMVVENWHGQEYGNPLRRTRETIEILRQVLSGEPVEYDGREFSLSGFRLRCEPPEPTPPIEVTGMGPKAVELAGRFADGWHGIMLTPDGLRERLEDLDRGAALGERDSGEVRVRTGVVCCGLEDESRARDLVRQHIAFYVGGMGTFYRDALSRQGYAEAEEIHDAWRADDRERALELVSDDLLEELCAVGTHEDASAGLERFESVEELDAIVVSFPRGASEAEIRETMGALAPDRR